MILDLIFIAVLLLVAVLLVCGKPLRIEITHNHKAEQPQLIDEEDSKEKTEPQTIATGMVEALNEFWKGE